MTITRRQIIKNDHAIPTPHQCISNMRPNKPSTAGDEVFHGRNIREIWAGESMGLAYPMVPISNPHLEFVDQALLSVIPYLAALLSTTPFISTQMVGALIFLGSSQGMRKMKGGTYE